MKTALMRIALIPLFFVCVLPAQAQDPVSPEMDKDIRTLMKTMGFYDLADQILGQMMGQLKQVMPDVPESYWNGVTEKADTGKLVELIIPIYGKHFNHEEIKGLIAFYETPVGKKVTATLPAITQESMAAGEKWGMALAQEVIADLEKKDNK